MPGAHVPHRPRATRSAAVLLAHGPWPGRGPVAFLAAASQAPAALPDMSSNPLQQSKRPVSPPRELQLMQPPRRPVAAQGDTGKGPVEPRSSHSGNGGAGRTPSRSAFTRTSTVGSSGSSSGSNGSSTSLGGSGSGGSVPGSRRLIWRAAARTPATAAPPTAGRGSYRSGGAPSPPGAVMPVWLSAVQPHAARAAAGGAAGATASAPAAAAVTARVRSGSNGVGGAFVSLGPLGQLLLPPYTSSGSSRVSERRRERAGGFTDDEEEDLFAEGDNHGSVVGAPPRGPDPFSPGGRLGAGVTLVGAAAAAAAVPRTGPYSDPAADLTFSTTDLAGAGSRGRRGTAESDGSAIQLSTGVAGQGASVSGGGGGGGGGGGNLFGLINRCTSWRQLRQLHHSSSAWLLPEHIPALMAAAAKLCGGGQLDRRSAGRAPPPGAKAEGGLQEREEMLRYMWELAGSALRLARSRELPPRSIATAMWAVAKLPLDEGKGDGRGGGGGTEAETLQHLHPQQQHLKAGLGVGMAAAGHVGEQRRTGALSPRREEWLVWAREMARCCCCGGGGGSDSPALLAGFSPQDVSQTLWAVASLDCTPLPRGFLAALLQSARPRLSAFGPQALSNSLWALSRLRCQPPPAWLAAACAAAAPQLGAFNAQALATTAAALAHLDYTPPDREWGDAFLDACAKTMWAPSPPPPSAAAPAPPQAWNGVGPPPSPPAAAAAAAAAAVRQPFVAPQSLAQMAWGVARMGLRPSPVWLQGLAGAAAAAVTRMNGQDVANLLWALGALRYRYSYPAGQAAPAATSLPTPAGARQAPAAVPRVEPLLAAWQRRLDSMQPQQLSACLVASVHLGLQLELEPEAEQGRGQRTASVAPSTLMAAGSALQQRLQPQQQRHADVPSLPGGLVERSLEALGRRLPYASGQAVANSLWAAARLGVRPSSGWVGAALERFMQCLEDDDAGPQEVANVWWSLGRLRWAPPADTASELLSRSLALALAGDLRSGETAMVLWALGRLGIRLPKPLMDRLVRVLRSSLLEEQDQQPLQSHQSPQQQSLQQQQQQSKSADGRSAAPWVGPSDGASAPADPATLVTLLRALAARQATSQRSSVSALLERSLRHLAASLGTSAGAAGHHHTTTTLSTTITTAAGAAQGSAEAAHDSSGGAGGSGAAGEAAARQLALALHAAASLEVSLWPGSGRPGASSSRGLAGAVVEALRAVLPFANSRDLAMALSAAAAMEAALPMGLLAGALERAGQLYGNGGGDSGVAEVTARGRHNAPGGEDGVAGGVHPAVSQVDGSRGRGLSGADEEEDRKGLERMADLATVLCSTGRLLELHVQRRAEMAAQEAAKGSRWRGGDAEGGAEVGGGPGDCGVQAGQRPSDVSDSPSHAVRGDEDCPGSQGDPIGGPAALGAAAAREARARWEVLVQGHPRLVWARTALLAVITARLEASPATAASASSSAALAPGRRLSPDSVQQLILGLSQSRLAPKPRLMRLLARSLVREVRALPADLMTACLSHLAAMGADMDPRVARVLVARLRQLHLTAAPSGGPLRGRRWVAAACTGVRLMVAMWVLRKAAATHGSRFAARALASANVRKQAGRSRLRHAATRVDPAVMRGIGAELAELLEEAECRRLR